MAVMQDQGGSEAHLGSEHMAVLCCAGGASVVQQDWGSRAGGWVCCWVRGWVAELSPAGALLAACSRCAGKQADPSEAGSHVLPPSVL